MKNVIAPDSPKEMPLSANKLHKEKTKNLNSTPIPETPEETHFSVSPDAPDTTLMLTIDTIL